MASTQATPAQLRDTITLIDNHAQDALNAIAAICSLALAAMETPQGIGDVTSLASALEAMRDRAEQARDTITDEATQVGCRWVHAPEERRTKALFEARDRRDAIKMLEAANA